ncbi:MAG: DUF1178 family protein [Pseudomonadota bacterium]
MLHMHLICECEYAFDGWFRDHETLEKQIAEKQLNCPSCNSCEIKKALSTPNIITGKKRAQAPVKSIETQQAHQPKRELNDEAKKQLRQYMQQLRSYVEENFENVGKNFAKETIAIHKKEKKSRPIYGVATQSEAIKMREMNINYLGLPWFDEEKKQD